MRYIVDDSMELIGGNNQKVYRAKGGCPDSVIKVLGDDFHGDSPHKNWSVEERIDASVNAYKMFPELFPETKKIADDAIEQDYFQGGITYGEALKNCYVDSLTEIFGNLKKVHDSGYIHADMKGDNLSTGTLSVDTETFGLGDYRHDLKKARKIAGEKNRIGVFDSVISDVYKICLN